MMMGSRFGRRREARLPPMRQGRGSRDGFDYPGLNYFFEDLAVDPRDPRFRRAMHNRFTEGYGFDHQFYDRRRSSDERGNPDERRPPPRPDIGGGHSFERGLALARPGGTPPVPFGRAMRDLHRELGRAQELYNRCLSDFENDVSTIRRYTNADTLSGMWAAKVDGVRDRRNFPEGDDQGADENGEKFRQKFTEMEEKVRRALDAAASSTLNVYRPHEGLSDRKQARLAASERMKQKVHLEMDQLLNLMEDAKASREHCRHLVHELELLQSTVNPEEQMNQELFRPIDDDEDINAEEQPDGEGAI